MSMLASYKRYWEPSLPQVLVVSLPVGAGVTLLTYPLEFIKTRIQVRAEGIGIVTKNHYMGYNSHRVFREIHESGVGLRGFFVGAEAAVLARVGYLFIRNILYKTIYDRTKPRKVTNDLTGREKGVISGFAGGLAALVTSPLELIQTRQAADGGLPQNIRRNYQGITHAYQSIISSEGGNKALFKGGFTTVLRAVAMNASMTGPYDWLREKMWITFGDFGFIDVIPIFYAAAWGTAITLPIDNIKTKLQRAFPDPLKNRIVYRSFRDAVMTTIAVEGPLGFYVGLYPYYCKMVTMCFLTSWLQARAMTHWKRQAGLQEWQI